MPVRGRCPAPRPGASPPAPAMRGSASSGWSAARGAAVRAGWPRARRRSGSACESPRRVPAPACRARISVSPRRVELEPALAAGMRAHRLGRLGGDGGQADRGCPLGARPRARMRSASGQIEARHAHRRDAEGQGMRRPSSVGRQVRRHGRRAGSRARTGRRPARRGCARRVASSRWRCRDIPRRNRGTRRRARARRSEMAG